MNFSVLIAQNGLLAQAGKAAAEGGLPPGKTQLVIIVFYLAALMSLGFFASRLFRGTQKDYLLSLIHI